MLLPSNVYQMLKEEENPRSPISQRSHAPRPSAHSRLLAELEQDQISTEPPRRLANSVCQNNGAQITITRTVYKCGGSEMRKQEYLARNGTDATCKTELQTRDDACWCPRDFMGPACQTWNPIICKITDNRYFLNCSKSDTDYFMASLNNGFAPCNYVDKNSIYKAKYIPDHLVQNG
jgi:hypothetical protein